MPILNYERNPEAIYRKSFDIVRKEADLDGLPREEAEIAARIIHACGMAEAGRSLIFSRDCANAGRSALEAGAAVVCDSRMVASGIRRDLLPANNRVFAAIDAPNAAELASKSGETRSAAAFELIQSELAGAVVAIGNAPTALFRLLELVDSGISRPALVVALPVGFVGAAESKAELVGNPRGMPFLTLPGRLGGSAMAAAAVNAICVLARRPDSDRITSRQDKGFCRS